MKIGEGLIAISLVFLCGGNTIMCHDDHSRHNANTPKEIQDSVSKKQQSPIETVLRAVNQKNTIESVVLEMEIKNNSDDPIEVCKYATLYDQRVSNPLMLEIIATDGKPLEFIGLMSRRLPPSRERGDFVTIAPRSSVKAKLDIAPDYKFRPGIYRIRFKGLKYVNNLPSSDFIEIVIEE